MRSALTILAGACCASLALAQPATRTETRSSTATFHRVSTVVGTTFTVGTDTVGKVADVVFDNGGCIEYVLVQDTDGFIVVPWSVVTVNYEQKSVTIQSSTITVDKLREARFAEGRLNFGDPAFQQKMTTVFGASAGRPRSDRAPGTTSPDRKGGTAPPDRTTPKGGTTPSTTEKPGTTTPPGKGEPPAKETPRKEPKKDMDKDGR
jgi:hypothetical protein